MINNFPKDFLLGVSLSSYQNEGGNYNCDWWYYERNKKMTLNFRLKSAGLLMIFGIGTRKILI